MVGLAARARIGPLLFLGTLSGAMADWLERRLFLLFSALAGVVVSLIMAAMLLSGDPQVWAVIGLVAAGGCVFAFTLTTRQAYTYDIVGLTRQEMIFDKEKLLAVYDATIDRKPM